MSRSCFCYNPIDLSPVRFVVSRRNVELMTQRRASVGSVKVRASKVESCGSPNFSERMERAWLISQIPVLDSGSGRYMHQMVSDRIYGGLVHQPRPVACSTCDSKGHVECKWCSGTGFFILGDNMLCQVPSRNTTCVICAGKGSGCCSDCKGTGYRAKWMGKPPVTK